MPRSNKSIGKKPVLEFSSDELKLYRIWQNMKKRCFNKNNPAYERYGGKGVSVCDRWVKSFWDFQSDMGLPPEGMTLDRIDSNGDYSPSNCRWATPLQQSRNRPNYCRVVTVGGQSMVASEAVEKYASDGISYKRVMGRLYRGWNLNDALSTPVLRSRHDARNPKRKIYCI